MSRKREEHLIAYKRGDVRAQIDFIMSKGRSVKVFDCRVIPGEECLTQHRLVCADMVVKGLKKSTRREEDKNKEIKRS